MTTQSKISVITCTGDRPICFDLLKQWMENQILKPMEWIIIDDGKTPMSKDIVDSLPSYATLLRREPLSTDPKHTMNINLLSALKFVQGDFIAFMEDDEYYAPEYLSAMNERMKNHSVVGICKSRYYHLPTAHYCIHLNMDHASLAQTIMSIEHLEKFKQLLDGDPFVDIRIWTDIVGVDIWGKKGFNSAGHVFNNGRGILFDDVFTKEFLYVGMKGMPGRTGIGSGHKGLGRFDPNFTMLKTWIKNGDHLSKYLQLQSTFEKYGRKTELILMHNSHKPHPISGRKMAALRR